MAEGEKLLVLQFSSHNENFHYTNWSIQWGSADIHITEQFKLRIFHVWYAIQLMASY